MAINIWLINKQIYYYYYSLLKLLKTESSGAMSPMNGGAGHSARKAPCDRKDEDNIVT
jgi:hypothetical protein